MPTAMPAMPAPADLTNWQKKPYMDWAFRNPQEFLHTATIKKSTQPRPLRPVPSGVIDEALDHDIKEVLQRFGCDSAVVLHRGQLLYEYYDNGNDADSRHILMSVSKSMTSLIAGAMAARGYFRPDDLVISYLPELAHTAFAPATIQHLLDMRSGITFNDRDHTYRMACGWAPLQPDEEQIDMTTFFSTFKPAHTKLPGSGVDYTSVNTDVLGLLLERVSGMTYAELAHEFLFEPAGAEADGAIVIDRSGNPRAAGGVCAGVRDLARIGQAVLEGKVVPRSWIEDTLHGGDPEAFLEWDMGRIAITVMPDLTYRSCFMVIGGDQQILYAFGIHGQAMLVDLKNDLVMAKLACNETQIDAAEMANTVKLFLRLQDVLNGGERSSSDSSP